VHEANRTVSGAAPHAEVSRWLDFFRRRYGELERDPQQWCVEPLLTVTRRTIDAWDEVLQAQVERGIRVFRLQPLDASRYDAATWKKIGYSSEEYTDFYRRAFTDIVELNRRGVDVSEGLATVIAGKILRAEDPGIVDIQSPYGAGTAQIAYDADGVVFPCDEARRADMSGDGVFALGAVTGMALADVARHPTVRAIAAASLLDAQPLCADCWNKPFCGYSPVRNFLTRGDLFGRRTSCFECAEHIAVARQVFARLGDTKDAGAGEILERWVATRSPHALDGRARIDPF
jgi:radical SAM protein with 4Fe4S-binding SPASM domain